jgi:hypothetical protein
MAQVVEFLLSNLEALSTTPSTTKKKNEEEEEREW